MARTDTAIRVSNIKELIRQSPRSAENQSKTQIEQLHSPVDIRTESICCSHKGIQFPISSDVPVTIVTIPVSIGSVIESISAFDDLKTYQHRMAKVEKQFPEGLRSVEIALSSFPSSFTILIIENVTSTAHVFGIDEGIVHRHVFIFKSTILDVHEVFGQDGDDDCVVCLSERKSVILMPCLHMCICSGCNRQIDRCPVCRSPIERFLSEQPGTVSEEHPGSPPEEQIVEMVSPEPPNE